MRVGCQLALVVSLLPSLFIDWSTGGARSTRFRSETSYWKLVSDRRHYAVAGCWVGGVVVVLTRRHRQWAGAHTVGTLISIARRAARRDYPRAPVALPAVGGATLLSTRLSAGGSATLPSTRLSGGGGTTLPSTRFLSGGGGATLPSTRFLSGGGGATLPSTRLSGGGGTTLPSTRLSGGGGTTLPSTRLSGGGGTTLPSTRLSGGGGATLPSTRLSAKSGHWWIIPKLILFSQYVVHGARYVAHGDARLSAHPLTLQYVCKNLQILFTITKRYCLHRCTVSCRCRKAPSHFTAVPDTAGRGVW
jgi:hypothetical protein